MKKCQKLIIFFFFILLINKKIILEIPRFDNPEVSIIIPVYNNFRYTYKCISSILKSETKIPFEIIIGNDMSKDKTRIIDKYFINIIVINNNQKLNYLKNCNQAAKRSKGKYILFLNNDTKVHKEWLTFLINLIESDNTIGMVGSKLIYLNGRLQEAGGIVWKNGECSNFGRGQNPDLPEYNYVKEVDYISGASIIIRKSIWEIIGGFDEKYSPAYYEDTDFAFRMRKHGYKVMYQPKSIVEHFEGVSNGKDISKGIKRYQLINKIKFIKKWENELKNQEEQGNYFLARDRGYNNRILVIDYSVPTFDKSAGSRCSFMYLKLFKEIGLQVTFLGDDLKIYEPYTTILQQKGIEVLYGNFYKKNLRIWLKNNLKYFNYVYLQRPDIAHKYIDLIKNNFAGKIIYFAHDLQFLRLFREYNITHEQGKMKQSINSQKIEFDIFSKVDVIYIVGNYEEKILKQNYKTKIIRNIPIYIYEHQLINIEKDFSKRKDLIFVGGFRHSPNKDGVLWFSKEIYPEIVKKFPDIIWHIVGSNIPDEIRKLESENIKVEGYLSDEELFSLYQKCRLAIAPLRFGAGVKGKIIEAAYNQIPIITTSIGAEGLDNKIGVFLSENNPEKLAKLIIELYVDFDKLKKMSDFGKQFIDQYFSIKRAKEVIMKDITIIQKKHSLN